MSDNTSDPGRIERDLDATRSRLGSHLSELQDRLSPGQVLDDAMKYFRGSEGADFGRNLLDSVRANPLPAALTGIGLAWLMASGPRTGTANPALAGALRTSDLRTLLGNIEDFSRRQQALFVGATLAAGFALTRLGRVAVAGGSQSDLPKLPEVSLERK